MRYPNVIHTNPLHILLGWRGVFFAVFAGFILTACGGVSAPLNVVVNSTNVVVDCEANPFDASCGDEFALHRTEKINECLIDDMAGTSECAQAVDAQSCLGDPFVAACDENAEFSAFLEVAKQEREAFCSRDNNADDSLCVGAVATLCGGNPFYRLCTAKSYTDQQEQIVADCITDDKAGESPCAAAVKFNPCVRNPFTPECIAQTDFRTTRETFCRKDDNAANALCAGALAHFCELDPFDAICDDNTYSRQQSERTALCISDDNASNTALCTGANDADANDCIRDPFTSACSTQEVPRSIRESFCRKSTNATDNPTLCNNAVVYVCDSTARADADPFDGLCDEMTYSVQRGARVTACIAGDKANDDALCENAIDADKCILDPYATGCESQDSNPTAAQTARTTFCRAGNEGNALCASTVRHVCTIVDPFDRWCDAGTYSSERATRLMVCQGVTDLACTNALRQMGQVTCESHPYGAECKGNELARMTRENHCREGENRDDTTLCKGAVTHFCTIDPFDSLCNLTNFTRYTEARRVFEGFCRADVAGRANDAGCANVVKYFCTVDPFDSLCNMNNFTTFAADRGTRDSLCRESGNALGLANDAQCTGVLAHFCGIDPFDGVCDPTTYETEREGRVAECITGDNANDDALCANAIAADVNNCIRDPYGAGCESQDSNPTAAQTARTKFCRAGNESNALCTSTVSHFCMIDPFDGLCDPSDYSSERNTRLMKCEEETPDPTLACINALAQGKCNLVDPFIEGCERQINQVAAEEVFCRKGTNAITRANDCDATITRVCGADPFDKLCDEGTYSGERATRVTACIAEDKANDDTLCANAIAYNACIRDPYGAGCDGDVDSDGMDEAQMMRETHCRAGNRDTPLCAGAVVHFCTIDPFDALCDDNTYSSQQMERTALCIKDANASDPALCGGAIADADVDCITDPFTTACVGADTARTARETFCRGNSSNALCVNAVLHFCDTDTRPEADPFDGLCDEITHSGQRATRVTACIAGDKADDPTCANAVKFNACIRNPFTTECSTETVAQTARKIFCDKDNNAANPLCAGAVLHFCELDPFDDLCNNYDYSRQKSERAALCIKDANASDADLCTGANDADVDDCIRDPFTTDCSTQEVFRSIRESFCRKGTNAVNNTALCDNAVVYICDSTARAEADPFDGLCDEMTYSVQRGNRVTACITGDKASDDALCANAIVDDGCISDPYAEGCKSQTSTLTPAQTARETYCRGNVNPTLCAGAITHFCANDPFDGLCDEGTYLVQRGERVTACIAGDKANDVALCANAVKFNTCIRNPFTTECSTETVAQTARKIFCDKDNNKTNALCAGAVVHYCTIDPYDALCDENTYSSQQSERTALCISGDNASDAPLCTKAILANPCIGNPFGTGKEGAGCNAETTARNARESYCRGNDNTALCAGAITHFCSADPFDSICKESNFDTLIGDRATRVTACIAGDKANDVALCANAVKFNACIRDPYSAGCDDEDDARMMRKTHCDIGNNENTALCAGAVVHFCTIDPYDDLCNMDNFATFTADRAARVATCAIGDNASKPALCGGAIADAAVDCITDPYIAGCKSQTSTLTPAQTARETYCRGNVNPTLCANAIVYFCDTDERNGADPFDALCDPVTYEMQRETRSSVCESDPVGSLRCVNARLQQGQITCDSHPYGATCAGNESARMTRELFCRMNDNRDLLSCAGAVLHFCELDPFDELCNPTRYALARSVFEGFCRADVAPVEGVDCANAITHFCTIDPFDSLCDPMTYELQRNTRNMNCRTETDTLVQGGDKDCTGVVAHYCDVDPYDGICDPDTYRTERMARDDECIIGDNARAINPEPRCIKAIAADDNNCIRKPYGTECGTGTLAQTARETFCRGNPRNPRNPLCAGAVLHFCDTGTRSEANPFDADLCFADMTYDNTREGIITGCITDNNTRLDDADCTNAVAANPCIRTPFDRNCEADFADYYLSAQAKRTTFCAGQTDKSLDDSFCAGAIASDPCFNNPFVRRLNDGAYLCGSEFAARREVQIDDCIVGDAGKNVGCLNVLAGVGGCLANPFQKSCEDADNLYFKDHADRARAERVKFCDMDDKTIKDVDYCVGRTFVHDICIYDPFSSFCADESFNVAEGTTLQAERTKKIIDCGGDDNEDHGSCAHVRDLVTAATWAHGFDNPLKTERPTVKGAFLRATSASELNEGASGAVRRTKLNLATNTFDDIEFGDFDIEFGDPESGRNAHDGVEFFEVIDGSEYYYYAGILGAANLGVPLIEGQLINGQPINAKTVLNWNGRIGISTISTINLSTGFPITEQGSQTDFTLTIEFMEKDDDENIGTLTSFAKVFLDRRNNLYYYDIKAKFNESGLITSGTVVFAQFINGDKTLKRVVEYPFATAELRGIIGQEGALGVFQGTDFAGGFVAHPTIQSRVEYSDWVGGFDVLSAPAFIPTSKNQFLQQTGNSILVGQVRTEAHGSQRPVIEKLELNADSAVNEALWFSGFIGSTQYYYAVLSKRAYLGAPLSEAPVSSTWYGRFGVGEYKIDFALDITFAKTNGISGGTISAFVRESAGVYYLLEGDFNRAGVIRGTVNYGEFTNGVRNAPAAGRPANGTLTGLIGQGGVLGVFISGTRLGFQSALTDGTGGDGYSGGFYASATASGFGTVVDYADWVRSFLFLADQPDTITPQNQFLRTADLAVNAINTIGTTRINGGSTLPTVSTLNLLTATNFDGGTLGGLAANAVEWFSGYIGATQYHYAGVFEDANLGAPLTATPAGGEWRGIIGVGGAQTDFTLTIDYVTDGGTISAFVRDTTDVYYLLEGGFDANGLIDGTVRYGEFANRDKTTPVGTTVDGVLTGLIGADGALGVFHSKATGAEGYSGGFVARPNAPEYAVEVKYSDYRRSFLTLALPDTTTPKNQFVTEATGVMTESSGGTPAPQNSLALDTTTFDNLALGGVAGNSLFWFDGFAGSTTRTYYAGLDTTADLGAPIIGRSDTAQWRGVFGAGIAKTDFTLNITFTATGGTVAAFVHELEDNYYLLDGEFDASGLITGTVRYSEFTNRDKNTPVGTTVDGVLTGLIGAEGAIGAFYSDDTGVTGYSGGFVARDNVAAFDGATVRYVTWTRGFLLADTPDVSKPRNQFLRALTDTLDITGGNNSTIVNLNTAEFNGLSIGGLDTNRYQSFNRTLGGTSYNYAGILPSTDLGAPVAQDGSTSAIWYGSFRGVNAGTTHTTDFVLHLTFDGTGGTLSARANYRSTDYYTLAGDFDAGGLITGTVAYNSGSFEATPTNGILTGLIGASGAVGVFIGDTSNNYGGGFVAKAKADDFTDSVKYSDWIARENPDLNPTAQNQFLQTTDKAISIVGTTTTPPHILSLNSTLFDNAPILGDIDDGVAYFVGTIGGTAYAYAGIFNSTDLGAPLTQTDQSIVWNGVVGLNGTDKDASFTITFIDKNGGTIEAFIADIIATNDLRIAGTFDDLGLITGTVHYAAYTDNLARGMILNTEQAGVLSGLLGQEGAVAAFHSTATGADAYSGGFIASAGVKQQVIATIWQDSFTNAAEERIHDDPITNLGDRRNQFLSGKAANYNDIKTPGTGNLAGITTFGLGSASGAAEATYKGIPLGGDNVGGVGYIRGVQTGETAIADRLYYAFLNDDSKIGVQIGQTTGTAYYNGQFNARAASFTNNIDFRLTVNFGEETIGALIQEAGGTNNYFHLSGSYDPVGVITGTVQYGKFSDTAGVITGEDVEYNRFTAENLLVWTDDANRRSGFLSGIISKDNVLGVFVSGTALEERGVVTGGRGNIGLVGGFVARRFDFFGESNANVAYSDWAQWFSPRATADTADTSTQKNQFLTTLGGISTQGTTAPTAITTATLNDVYYKPVTIPGDAKDGFSYFMAGNYGYAGILESTDLGAPVQGFNGTKATWHGQLNFRNAEHDFSINITYDGAGGGTIAGFLANIVSPTDFALYGDFNEHGVITGLTKFAQYTNDTFDGMAIDAPNGILTGIIGQGGAVGVFHSTATGVDGYVGGFVVHPQVVDSADVNYSDWIRGKSYLTDPTDRSGSHFLTTTDGVISRATTDAELSDITYLTLNNATLGLTKNVVKIPIPESPLDFTTRSVDNPVMVDDYEILKNTFEGVPIGGDANDGIAYYEAEGNTYAGILDSTNLGKPLTQTTGKLNWHGQLHLTANFDNATNNIATYTRDFVLTITFNSTGGTLEGVIQELDDSRFNNPNQVRIEDYLAYERDFNLSEATFDTNGVITGKAIYRSANVGKSSISFGNRVEQVGTLTGLIGQEGAVAVFNNGNISTTSTRWAGGFVVQPNVLGTVTYADWVRANPAPLIEKQFNGVVTPFVESGTDSEADNLPGIFDVPLWGSHFLTTKNGVISRGSKDPGHSFIREVGTVNRHITEENPDNRVAREATYVRFGKGNDIGDGTIGGFAYYTGFISTREPLSDGGRVSVRETVQSYTGILDDTNLGAPLTETTGTTAQWKGQIGYSDFVSGGFYNLVVPFDLNITYTDTGGKIDAFIMNIGESNPATFLENTEFYLEGTFDLRGVIYGYTLLENRADAAAAASRLRALVNAEIYDLNSYEERSGITASLGILTGLIGEKGAVGVWYRPNPDSSGAGGFVAAPSAAPVAPTPYAAWQDSFASTPPTTITSAQNRFLSDSDTVFDNLRIAPSGGVTPAPITTLDLGGSSIVSFANGYFNDASNTTRSFHAVIDKDANLGGALPVWQNGQTASATWQGTFRARQGNGTTTDASFDLKVNFQTRAVEAFVPITPASITHYHLRGEFPANLKGAIIGTVDHGDFTDSNRLLPTGDSNRGVFTGLIGTQGAIGVFISGTRAGVGSALTGGTGDTGYSGGFVASP